MICPCCSRIESSFLESFLNTVVALQRKWFVKGDHGITQIAFLCLKKRRTLFLSSSTSSLPPKRRQRGSGKLHPTGAFYEVLCGRGRGPGGCRGEPRGQQPIRDGRLLAFVRRARIFHPKQTAGVPTIQVASLGR